MKIKLKLAQKNTRGYMMLQKHKITREFQEFELSPEEVKELNSPGGKHWFMSPEKVEKKKPAKKD